LSVLNTQTNRIDLLLPVGNGAAGLAVNVAAKRVLVTNAGSGTLSRIDATTNRVLDTIAVGGAPGEIALSPDGARAFTTGAIAGQPGTLAVIDPERADLRRVAALSLRRPQALALSPDARRLWVTSGADGTVAEVDTGTNAILRALRVGVDPTGLAMHPDGSRVYVANRGSDSLSIVRTDPAAGGLAVRTISVGRGPSTVCAAPDGRRIYVLNAASRDISVIDTAIDEQTERLVLGTNSPAGMQVSPDSRRLYATSFGSSVLSQFDVTRPAPAPLHTALPFRPFGLDTAPGGSPIYVAGQGDGGAGVLGFVEASDLRLLERVPFAAESAPFGVYTAPNGARVYVTHAPHPVLSAVDAVTRRVSNVFLTDAEPLSVVVKP
jgi:YVTN family beta-propeller protein